MVGSAVHLLIQLWCCL